MGVPRVGGVGGGGGGGGGSRFKQSCCPLSSHLQVLPEVLEAPTERSLAGGGIKPGSTVTCMIHTHIQKPLNVHTHTCTETDVNTKSPEESF